MATLDEITNLLRTPEIELDYAAVAAELEALKVDAVCNSDEPLAKQIWRIESIAATQQLFRQAFNELKTHDFYPAWCTLEQVELSLGRLRPHMDAAERHQFKLQFIEQKCADIARLYPYRVFSSPEFIYLETRCTICGRVITPRKPCGHRVGEIYHGFMCGRIIKKSELKSLAIVENPVQKYSVLFLKDPDTGKTKDQFNYSPVQYLADRWPEPYLDWQVTFTQALHPYSKFGTIRRNDPCPCNSGKKFKSCCRLRGGVLKPHILFNFTFPVPQHLQNIEFNY